MTVARGLFGLLVYDACPVGYHQKPLGSIGVPVSTLDRQEICLDFLLDFILEYK